MKKIYYRSQESSVCADVIPYFEDGEFKLFYLRDYRNVEKHGEGCPWCLLTTNNLLDYVDHGEVLKRGTVDDQDLYVFTGSIFKKDDIYYIYYTGHNPHLRQKGLPEQKILRATSKDLINWEKDKDFVFEAPDYLEKHDFRDPFIYFDKEKGLYGMLIAARTKDENPSLAKGVTLVAYSKDFDHWELSKEPFYAPHNYFTHECPDLFKIGDWWYLLFSEFTDKCSTRYRMSKSINGPWIAPKVDTFDGHAFYAAKSFSDGNRRILFGWNPIKYLETDFQGWQWGGNIIPHEIYQNKDGTLLVRCPKEIKALGSETLNYKKTASIGTIIEDGNTIKLVDNGYQYISYSDIPDVCKIELEFKTNECKGDFGFMVRCEDKLERFYKVKFDPAYHRFALDSRPRADDNRFIQVDTERPFDCELGVWHKVIAIIQDSVIEVYVDDKVAMSGRMFDCKKGGFALYSQNCSVEFKNVKIVK